MKNSIMFSCTSLQGQNKVGNLKQLDNGYYRMVVGALNMFNSAGQFYTYEQAKAVFEESGALIRRVRRGVLRGEYGHPRQGSMTDAQFARRVLDVDEKSVCCHHRNIELVFDEITDDRGSPVVAIYSEVAPDGPYGSYLAEALQNPSKNVCFSIRAFTHDYKVMGVKNRDIRSVVTFDYVNEPGMSVAEKFKNPALEAHEDKVFSRAILEAALNVSAEAGIAQESTKLTAAELFASMGWTNANSLEHLLEKPAPWKGW